MVGAPAGPVNGKSAGRTFEVNEVLIITSALLLPLGVLRLGLLQDGDVRVGHSDRLRVHPRYHQTKGRPSRQLGIRADTKLHRSDSLVQVGARERGTITVGSSRDEHLSVEEQRSGKLVALDHQPSSRSKSACAWVK